MTSNRHAYLIMAHTQFDTLRELVRALDHGRHDIFIHVDVKARGFDASEIERAAVRSRLTFVDRLDVSWGSFSEIECELALLAAATAADEHQYYHLLSGMDFPLRDANQILEFFDQRSGQEEFIHLSPREEWPSVRYRVSTYHPWQPRLMAGGRAVNVAAKVATRIQMAVRVDRTRHLGDSELGFGSQWFSITHAMALQSLAVRPWIEAVFRSSQCASEMFMQTVALASPHASAITGDALRKIDWARGDGKHPHVWTLEDLAELESAPELFARKFDAGVDADVIQVLAARLRG